jgi:hypothetical protein
MVGEGSELVLVDRFIFHGLLRMSSKQQAVFLASSSCLLIFQVSVGGDSLF